jgi:drug/metabolite transporter (DMT)-like permease
LTLLTGTIVLVPMSLPWLMRQDWAAIPAEAWAGMLYSTVLAIVFCGLAWAWALRRVGVARTAVFQNVTPVIALLGGWGLLAERPSWLQGAGVLLALAGVFIVRSHRSQPDVLPGD